MDRLDAMKVFVLAVDEGSLAAAGRKLGRSPAAVSRAIAFLEQRVGAELLHRTTRSIKLSEEGERYVAICRRVLTDLEEAEDIAAGPRTAPRGLLTITAPVVSGEMVLRPILDAFLDAYPTVSAKLLLFDRAVNLIEEGVDIALRIGPLADSAMVAMRVGGISRVVVAAPRYLKQHPRIAEPGDLAKHQIVAMAHLPNSWTFAPQPGSSAPRTVQFTPRLVVNSTYAAVALHCGRARRGADVFVPSGRAGRAPRARDRAGGRRGSGDAGASDLPAGPAFGAQGARLHRLRRAPAEEAVCAAEAEHQGALSRFMPPQCAFSRIRRGG
ncbi:DNA-binding transcriptional LysR family regulator [Bradyrhizobium yuanmingense]